MRVPRRRTAAAAVLVCLAVLLTVGGTGYAKNDPAKKWVAKFYGASLWLPTNSETRWGGQLIGSLDCQESPWAEGQDMFKLPLDLPAGAEITKMTFYYFDTDPGAELHFWLSHHLAGVEDVADGSPDAVSEDQTQPFPEGANPSEVVQSVDVTPASPIVLDTENKSYMLSVGFSQCGTFTPQDPSETTFILADGVRVHYTEK